MNGGTIRGTALSMDGTARPWMGGYYERVITPAGPYLSIARRSYFSED